MCFLLGLCYDAGMWLFAVATRVAACFSPKIRKMVDGQRRTWDLLRGGIGAGDTVAWFHAASLGEFEQGRPIMELLRQRQPDVKILLTFFSPSGYEVRKDYEGADVVCYLPIDTIGNARRFVRMAHPRYALFIKYEFWNNFLIQARRHGAGLYSVSSIFRKGQRFFCPLWKPIALRQFHHLFVQDAESASLLASIGIGAERVTVTGDTRFDRVEAVRRAARPLPLIERFAAGRRVLVAGSSWEEDEQRYLPYFQAQKDWRLIIAPHVISEAHLQAIASMLGDRKWVRYTELSSGKATLSDEVSVIVVDCFGLLSSIYRYATVAVVGGGFGAGIHNVTEAAVYGIPVLFGPNNRKFREAQGLMQCGGGMEFNSAETFAAHMDRFKASPDHLAECSRRAGAYIAQRTGASERCYKAIFEKEAAASAGRGGVHLAETRHNGERTRAYV